MKERERAKPETEKTMERVTMSEREGMLFMLKVDCMKKERE